jgi:pimeloyl-ACP methyl ester carboxylesterase
MKLIFILLFVSLTAFGQSLKIGDVTFKAIQEDGKPKETVRGQIEVFENNLKNKGRTINLNIEVVPAKESENKADPMFIVMGGPGQAATDLVTFFSEIFKSINERSDLVFIDQRGTGKSNPLQLKGTYNNLSDYFKDDFADRVTIKNSFEALSKENNLTCYGTLNAIIDLDKVREMMGYKKINLYGTSYGTRVAIGYINKYPDRVMTATLKGLVPHDLVIPFNFADDAQRSLDILIEDCKENQACNTAYPDLTQELKTFFNTRFPVRVALLNPETQQKDTVELTKEIIALNIRVLLMSPSTTKNIPFLVSQFNRGNYDPLTSIILTIKKSYLQGIYDGMTLCVICNEDYPALTRLTKVTKTETFLGDYWIYRVSNSCEVWNPKKKDVQKARISKQDTPVLIISGNRDGATPPKYGDEILKYFPNGRHIVVKSGSHSFDGMRNCIENIICDFITTGQNKVLKTDCVDSIMFPEYILN